MSCEVCGHIFAERHRLIPGQIGGRYYDWNILYLCPNHHAAFHFLMTTAAKPPERRTQPAITRWNAYVADEDLWRLFDHLYRHITIFPDYLHPYTGPKRFRDLGYAFLPNEDLYQHRHRQTPDQNPDQPEPRRFRDIYDYKHNHEADEPELEQLVNALCDALQWWRDHHAVRPPQR